MKAAILALRLGCNIEHIAKVLNWKDFGSFASNVMKDSSYKVQTNIADISVVLIDKFSSFLANVEQYVKQRCRRTVVLDKTNHAYIYSR